MLSKVFTVIIYIWECQSDSTLLMEIISSADHATMQHVATSHSVGNTMAYYWYVFASLGLQSQSSFRLSPSGRAGPFLVKSTWLFYLESDTWRRELDFLLKYYEKHKNGFSLTLTPSDKDLLEVKPSIFITTK